MGKKEPIFRMKHFEHVEDQLPWRLGVAKDVWKEKPAQIA